MQQFLRNIILRKWWGEIGGYLVTDGSLGLPGRPVVGVVEDSRGDVVALSRLGPAGTTLLIAGWNSPVSGRAAGGWVRLRPPRPRRRPRQRGFLARLLQWAMSIGIIMGQSGNLLFEMGQCGNLFPVKKGLGILSFSEKRGMGFGADSSVPSPGPSVSK
jgi:hypothetical protein